MVLTTLCPPISTIAPDGSLKDVVKELFQLGEVIVLAKQQRVMHSSSFVLVAEVVPDDFDVLLDEPVEAVTSNPVHGSVLLHSSMLRVVAVALVKVTVAVVSVPSAILYRMVCQPEAGPYCTDTAAVQPGIVPPAVAAVPFARPISRLPDVVAPANVAVADDVPVPRT